MPNEPQYRLPEVRGGLLRWERVLGRTRLRRQQNFLHSPDSIDGTDALHQAEETLS